MLGKYFNKEKKVREMLKFARSYIEKGSFRKAYRLLRKGQYISGYERNREVMDLLTELNKQGTTIIMVTHSQHDAAFVHRIVNLFDGQMVTEEIARQAI